MQKSQSLFRSWFALGMFLLSFALADAVQAGVIYQPTSATSNMGTLIGNLNNLRNQGGLSSSYTSGVTNFDTYTSTTTHNFSGNSWSSTIGSLTGNVDFNMGTAVTVNALAFWNWGGNDPVSVKGFNLLADDNASFTSPTTLGTNYQATQIGTAAQIFTFASTTEQYFRIQILSNWGNSTITAFGEAAFGVAAVPEPTGITLAGCALVGLVVVAKRRRN